MEKGKASKCRAGSPTATRIFTLLLVICLVECATGSCLSYGHSCWGAHGKRSGKPPATAPDWYLTRILRRMAANAEMNRDKHVTRNDDLNAIYQVDMGNELSARDRLMADLEDGPMQLPLSRNPEAKPMLDDNMLSKMKLWQIMYWPQYRRDIENKCIRKNAKELPKNRNCENHLKTSKKKKIQTKD